MRHQEGLGVGANLVNDSVVLAEDEGKFVVVHLELLFLEEDDLGTLRDLNTDTAEALGLTNQGHDLAIEVDVELVVVWVTDNKCGKKASLGLLDLNNPSLAPLILKVEKVVGDLVVALHLSHGSSSLGRAQQVGRELLHRGRSSVEEVTGPCDGARDNGQVPDDGRAHVLLLVLIVALGT